MLWSEKFLRKSKCLDNFEVSFYFSIRNLNVLLTSFKSGYPFACADNGIARSFEETPLIFPTPFILIGDIEWRNI